MEKAKTIEIEDMITTRYRLDDPDVIRIGVEHGNAGWRCCRVWLHQDVPTPPDAEVEAILADANKMLTELLQGHELDDEQAIAPAIGLM